MLLFEAGIVPQGVHLELTMLKKALLTTAALAFGASVASAGGMDCNRWNKTAQTPLPVAEAPVSTPAPAVATIEVTEPAKIDVAQVDAKKEDAPKAN